MKPGKKIKKSSTFYTDASQKFSEILGYYKWLLKINNNLICYSVLETRIKCRYETIKKTINQEVAILPY